MSPAEYVYMSMCVYIYISLPLPDGYYYNCSSQILSVTALDFFYFFLFFFIFFTLSPLFLPSPRLVPQHPGRVSKELSLADRGGFSLLEGPGQQRTLSEVFSGTD